MAECAKDQGRIRVDLPPCDRTIEHRGQVLPHRGDDPERIISASSASCTASPRSAMSTARIRTRRARRARPRSWPVSAFSSWAGPAYVGAHWSIGRRGKSDMPRLSGQDPPHPDPAASRACGHAGGVMRATRRFGPIVARRPGVGWSWQRPSHRAEAREEHYTPCSLATEPSEVRSRTGSPIGCCWPGILGWLLLRSDVWPG